MIDDDRSAAEELLTDVGRVVERSARAVAEAALYVPLAAAAEVTRQVPEVVSSARERVERQIVLARMVGELAVKYGSKKLDRRLAELTGNNGDRSAPAPNRVTETEHPPVVVPIAAVVDDAEPVSTMDPVDLPIDDYESLAASQVVARLATLDHDELSVVAEFERAHRRRRTVLGKIDQLLRRR